MDKIKVSICVTSYNRSEQTIRSFKDVLHHSMVDEVVIVDDCSDLGHYNTLKYMVDRINVELSSTKVYLFRNEKNLDCYRNKRRAIELARNEWVIILDSDNIIDTEYLNFLRFYLHGGISRNTIIQPSFAKPSFDFRKYAGFWISTLNVWQYIDDPSFEVMLNAMNYCVNRDQYLQVFDESVDPVTSDSIYQNYNWFKSGGMMYVAKGVEYEHPISQDSHYKHNHKRTPPGFHEDIVQRIRDFKK